MSFDDVARPAEGAGSEALLRAWSLSFLAGLAPTVRDRVFAGAETVGIGRGEPLYEAYGPPRLALIQSGQARVKALSRDGRASTIRYAGPGQFIGLPAMVAGSAPVSAEAVVRSRVTLFNPKLVRSLAAANGELAWLIAQELARMNGESKEFLENSIFGSVEQRVARHLLELAVDTPVGIVVSADQNDIADSVGSVREVVARSLRKLREAGCIERIPSGLRVTSPRVLEAIAAGDTSGQISQ